MAGNPVRVSAARYREWTADLPAELTGAMTGKYVLIQPANVTVRGGIPATGEQKTYAIYSPVRLVH